MLNSRAPRSSKQSLLLSSRSTLHPSRPRKLTRSLSNCKLSTSTTCNNKTILHKTTKTTQNMKIAKKSSFSPIFSSHTAAMSTTTGQKKALVPKLPPGDTSKPYANARSIICLVRTYAEHAKELNNVIPPEPIVFLKPPSCLIMEKDIGKNLIEVPPTCSNLHHEIELGLIIGKEGRDISADNAMEYVSGYFLGLDMTAREIQGEAKSKGLPWSISKGYDTFGPISPPIPKGFIPDPSKLRLQLQVNGKEKQNCTTDLLLFTVPQLVAFISTFFTLHPGDLIYTGTPAGVGPVVAGDVITCQLTDTVTENLITEMQFGVIKRPGPAKL